MTAPQPDQERPSDEEMMAGLYQLVGQAVVNFQQTEAHLCKILWNLSGKETAFAKAATSLISFKSIIRLLSSLSSNTDLSAGLRSDLASIIKACQSLEERRNEIAHSWWVTDESGRFHRLKVRATKNGLIESPEPIESEFFLGYFRQCEEAGRMIDEFWVNHSREVVVWQQAL